MHKGSDKCQQFLFPFLPPSPASWSCSHCLSIPELNPAPVGHRTGISSLQSITTNPVGSLGFSWDRLLICPHTRPFLSRRPGSGAPGVPNLESLLFPFHQLGPCPTGCAQSSSQSTTHTHTRGAPEVVATVITKSTMGFAATRNVWDKSHTPLCTPLLPEVWG